MVISLPRGLYPKLKGLSTRREGVAKGRGPQLRGPKEVEVNMEIKTGCVVTKLNEGESTIG